MNFRLRVVCTLALLLGMVLTGCVPAHNQAEEEKEPHFLTGKSRVNAMDYKGAIESFQKALEINPQSASAHFELGWLYDQKESDPAAAIYHYESYLRLRADPDKTEMVKTRILACKQELARSVSLGPVMQSAQKELQQLAEENKRLREDLEKLRAYAQYLERLTNVVASSSPRTVLVSSGQSARPGTAVQAASADSHPRPVAQEAAGRTHLVRSGETLTAIGRRYGVKVQALLTANPELGADARRLRAGQTLKIPGSR